MRCKNVREKLADYALQRCEPAEQKGIADHLRHCPDCQHLLEGEKQICLFLKETPSPLPQRDLWPLILGRLEQRSQRLSLWGGAFQRRWALVLTPLILLVGLWFGYQRIEKPSVNPRPSELILAFPSIPHDPLAETTEDFLALLEYAAKE